MIIILQENHVFSKTNILENSPRLPLPLHSMPRFQINSICPQPLLASHKTQNQSVCKPGMWGREKSHEEGFYTLENKIINAGPGQERTNLRGRKIIELQTFHYMIGKHSHCFAPPTRPLILSGCTAGNHVALQKSLRPARNRKEFANVIGNSGQNISERKTLISPEALL